MNTPLRAQMASLPLLLILVVLGLALAAVEWRRAEHSRLRQDLNTLQQAKSGGRHRARLQYPWIDLSRCIGCGTCVSACPEEGVLEVIHGQAQVVFGSRCVGHGRCASECPVGAVALTLADRETRQDIPALTAELEAIGQPGLFLAGEVTGYALVQTAVDHGRRVAAEVARRLAEGDPSGAKGGGPRSTLVRDLVVVGAGPAGLSCSLEARRLGLDFVTLEQDEIGGTVAKYPRGKLVMTQPMDLPLAGRLKKTSYLKEELVELWLQLADQHQLPILEGEVLLEISRDEHGIFSVFTPNHVHYARHLCLALGRRGTPRKLGVPGEQSHKVIYSLQDARAMQERSILVVGGGDSAVEAALGLSEQPGNQVHLSYRREQFFRLKPRNEDRIHKAVGDGSVRAHFATEVVRIEDHQVVLNRLQPEARDEFPLSNDDVLVLAGGVPPFPLLEAAGVSFDLSLTDAPPPLIERGTGLLAALRVTFLLGLALAAWFFLHADYYALSDAQRIDDPRHSLLRPASGLGLAGGIAAVTMMLANLAYLARRSQRIPFWFGSLSRWMGAHVGTGVAALLLALLHAGFAGGNTLGGHALLGLYLLVATGGVGRYFYSFVPRAANGREMVLEEVQQQMNTGLQSLHGVHPDFVESARHEVFALIERTRWRQGFFGKLYGLLTSQRDLRRTLARLRRLAAPYDVNPRKLREVVAAARSAHRNSIAVAHLADLRTLLASWRYLHRWVALLVVLLVAAHVWMALRYARLGGMP